MFLSYYKNILLLKYNSQFLTSPARIIILVLALFNINYSQWQSNTSINTEFVVNSKDPLNIVSVENQAGGLFLFWEDNKSNQQEVLFQHIDETGKVTFRADGRSVNSLSGKKVLPVAIAYEPLSAIVLWKDFTYNSDGDLFAQKVFSNGTYGWGANGIQITKDVEVSDYSVDKDNLGNIYISYIEKTKTLPSEFILKIQKLNKNGNELFLSKNTSLIKNNLRKTNTTILCDNKGGAFILWLESSNNRIILNSTHADSTGKISWKEKQINISGNNSNVTTFSAAKGINENIYVAWQSIGTLRTVQHQLLNIKNKAVWSSSLTKINSPEGNQSNPNVLIWKNNLFVTWVNETNNDRDILMQSFNYEGKPLLNKNGNYIVNISGAQFGQKLILNEESIYVSWIDRRIDSIKANIYAQRFDLKGNPIWNPNGIIIASNQNSEKSYLNIIPDNSGGAIAVFKDKRINGNSIYGQKIFPSGVIVSEVLGFSANSDKGIVHLEWYGVNEQTESNFIIERGTVNDLQDIQWNEIFNINSKQNGGTNKYEYFDNPDGNGTFYYRIKYGDESEPTFSEVVKVTYFEGSDVIIVAQNIPNPFKDKTKISFFLPKSETVTIEFFNSRLEKISEIEKQKFPEGENEIEFDASGLYPGIYFYKFKVNDFIDVKKMVIAH